MSNFPFITGSNNVIAFTGPMYSGKTTAADYIVKKYNYKKIRFADAFKDMLKSIGLTDEQVNGSQRGVPLKLLCGKTPRWAMQSLGTEWGRNLIGDNLWANIWKQKARKYGLIVCDDCRFLNEVDAVRSLGGKVLRIDRGQKLTLWRRFLDIVGLTRIHQSEMEMRLIKPDRIVQNNSTPEVMYALLDKYVMGEW